MTYHRAYLKNIFPDYDYRKPTEPWRIDYNVDDHRPYVNFQLQAFTLYWVEKVCKEDGLPGLALEARNIPFCLSTSSVRYAGHIYSKPEYVHLIFEERSLPLIVATNSFPLLSCQAALEGKKCDDQHIIKTMQNWGRILYPGGYLIATIPDAALALARGEDPAKANELHIWSARRFQERILKPLEGFTIEEFDTLKNNFAFNFVLRRT